MTARVSVTLSLLVLDEDGLVTNSGARHVQVEHDGPSLAVRDNIEGAAVDALANLMDGVGL